MTWFSKIFLFRLKWESSKMVEELWSIWCLSHVFYTIVYLSKTFDWQYDKFVVEEESLCSMPSALKFLFKHYYLWICLTCIHFKVVVRASKILIITSFMWISLMSSIVSKSTKNFQSSDFSLIIWSARTKFVCEPWKWYQCINDQWLNHSNFYTFYFVDILVK